MNELKACMHYMPDGSPCLACYPDLAKEWGEKSKPMHAIDRIKALETQGNNSIKFINEYDKRIEALENNNKTNNDVSFPSIAHAIKEFYKRIEELETNLRILSSTSHADYVNNKIRIEEIEDNIVIIKERIEALEKQPIINTNIMNSIDNLIASEMNSIKRIEALESDIGDLKDKYEGIKVDILNHHSYFEGIDSRFEALEKENEILFEDFHKLQITLADCAQQVLDLQKERDLGVERIKVLERQNMSRVNECTLNARRLSEIESILSQQNFVVESGWRSANLDQVKSKEKKEGLTFIEAWKSFEKGKKIRRRSWQNTDYFLAKIMNRNDSEYVSVHHLEGNDWMILDD